MNIDFNQISQKNPKAFILFLLYLNQNGKVWYKKGDSLNNPYLREKLKTICYCDIEAFFDDNGIIIIIHYTGKKYWASYYYDGKLEVDHIDKEYDTRDEAKKHSPIRAFAIFEGKLNDN